MALLFDSTLEISQHLRTERGREEILARWPDEGEWSNWYRNRRTTIMQLGRGQSTLHMDNEATDLKLYEAIRLPGSPDLDPTEAAEFISRVAKREVVNIESQGDYLTLTLDVLGGTTKHHVRIPTVREVTEFRRAASQVVSLPFNKQQIRLTIEPGARLYDKIRGEAPEGYSNGSIPAIHKDEVVRAAIQFVESEADEANP